MNKAKKADIPPIRFKSDIIIPDNEYYSIDIQEFPEDFTVSDEILEIKYRLKEEIGSFGFGYRCIYIKTKKYHIIIYKSRFYNIKYEITITNENLQLNDEYINYEFDDKKIVEIKNNGKFINIEDFLHIDFMNPENIKFPKF